MKSKTIDRLAACISANKVLRGGVFALLHGQTNGREIARNSLVLAAQMMRKVTKKHRMIGLSSRRMNTAQSIREIILTAESRAMAVDGPVDATVNHLTDRELQEIYAIATVMHYKTQRVKHDKKAKRRGLHREA